MMALKKLFCLLLSGSYIAISDVNVLSLLVLKALLEVKILKYHQGYAYQVTQTVIGSGGSNAKAVPRKLCKLLVELKFCTTLDRA